MRDIRDWVGAFAGLGLIGACQAGVHKDPVWVPPAVASEIDTIDILYQAPEETVVMHDYIRSRWGAAGEGAGSAFGEGMNQAVDSFFNDCNDAECLVIPLLLPFIIPMAGAGNAALSDDAEEIARQEQEILAAFEGWDMSGLVREAVRSAVASETPYLIADSRELPDAFLDIRMRPLSISGERLERQNVRPRLRAYVTFAVMNPADGGWENYSKEYSQAYRVRKLGKLSQEIETLKAWIPRAIDAMAAEIADDIYSGFEALSEKFEIDQPRTELLCLFRECKPKIVDSLTPELSWFPMTEETLVDDGAAPEISYEVRVYEVTSPLRLRFDRLPQLDAARAIFQTAPVYTANSLREPSHEIEAPLAPCTEYLWRLRSTLTFDDDARVSDWRDFYLETDKYGTVQRRMPWFKTPCPAEDD